MAAASLDPAFTRIADAFEEAHPDATVRLSFGASSSLAQQILDGAPAGVFASADQVSMERVARERPDLSPVVFATNHMSIAVPAGNPAGVSGVQDFSRADLRLGICAPQVPCGRYAAAVFRSAGVEPRVDTEEPDVTSLLAKVASGDLDAGVVYATDVTNGGGGGGRRGVDAVPIPASEQVRATYPIVALVSGSEAGRAEADLAAAFVEFVLGPGQEFLTATGFGPP